MDSGVMLALQLAADNTDFTNALSQLPNYGVLGLLVIAIFAGWVVPKPTVDRIVEGQEKLTAEHNKTVERMAADHDRAEQAWQVERDRLIAEKRRVEEQRDAALAIAQDKIIPLAGSLASTAQTFIPLIQEIVREGSDDHRRR